MLRHEASNQHKANRLCMVAIRSFVPQDDKEEGSLAIHGGQ